MSEIFVQNGIVDKVRAVRRQDEVQYLEATVHLSMGEEYHGQYGDKVTSDMLVPLPINTTVNPGDVVAISMHFENPFHKRFQPALEVGENPADVMNEDILVGEGDER